MRVLVLGGGVVGVTTAYQAQRDGHEVVLIERNSAVAEETSWGNAGMIAPGHSFVWSSPSAPVILMKSLFLADQALRFRPSLDRHLYSWSLRFLRECTRAKARNNTLLKHRLAVYSQSVLADVVAREGLQYDRSTRGILYFHRSEKALQRGIEQMKLLESDGQEVRILDRRGIVRLDPSLQEASEQIVGGIFCPTDEIGDSSKFTKALADIIVRRGGELRAETNVLRLQVSGGEIDCVITDKGAIRADVYVLALGSYSPSIARTIGLELPVYPIKGYSLTIPIGNHRLPPTISSVDEMNLVAITRLGDRIRVTATAEFAGYSLDHKPADFKFMKQVVQELYPYGGEYQQAEMWAGLRPMTPTNMPLIGRHAFRNLFLNTGHGHIGWTMSHGSARILADLLDGRKPAIPTDGLMSI